MAGLSRNEFARAQSRPSLAFCLAGGSADEENLEARGVLATEKAENHFAVATFRVQDMLRLTRRRPDDVVAAGSEFVAIGIQRLVRGTRQIDQQ